MTKIRIASFFLVGFIFIPNFCEANTGDFSGGIAIGSSYAGTATAPTNGMIVQGNIGIGTTTPSSMLDVGNAGTVLGTMRLNGSTSGYVQLQPAAAAGSWSMTLPPNAGTNSYVLQTNGSGTTSWIAQSSGTPAGSNTQIQFNNSGVFGADSNFNWDMTTHRLGIGTTTPTSALHVSSSSYPVGLFVRAQTSVSQPDTSTAQDLLYRSTNTSIVDGTGPELSFSIQGNTTPASPTIIADIGAVRDGADNSGKIAFYPYNTGVSGGPSNPKMVIDHLGRVGIGTPSPNALLDIGIPGTILGVMRFNGNASGYVQLQPAAAAGSWTMTLPSSSGTSGYVLQTDGTGSTSWVPQAGSGSLPGGSTGQVQFNNAGAFGADSNFFWDSTNHRLGIGTTSPGAAIQVNNSNFPVVRFDRAQSGVSQPDTAIATDLLYQSLSSSIIDSTGPLLGFSIQGNSTPSTPTGIAAVGAVRDGADNSGKIVFFPYNAGTGGTAKMVIDHLGNVGIGTTSPAAAFHVSNVNYPVGIFSRTLTSVSQPDTSTALDLLYRSTNTAITNGTGPELSFSIQGNTTPASPTVIADIGAVRDGADNSGKIAFYPYNAGVSGGPSNPKMVIDHLGHVGIGTASPVTTFDIAGYMKLQKNSAAPSACSSTLDGSIALTSHYTLCTCNGSTSTWVSTADGTTTCSW